MKNYFVRLFVLIGLGLGLLFGTSGYAATRRSSVSGNRQTTIKGSEKFATRTMPAPDFHAVNASRGVEVVIGGADEIVIKANDNVMEYVVAEVKNGLLEIGISDRVNVRNAEVTVRIPNNGKINSLRASSGADMRTESALKTTDMEIRLSSAASLDIALKAERCNIRMSSGSDMKAAVDLGQCNIGLSSGSEVRLSGKVDAVVANLSSGSELNAFELESRVCEISVGSGADAEVKCSEKLTARASSGGEIKYKGDCRVDRKSSSGGAIKKR